MDDTDRQLLSLLQNEIPLKSRPFDVLGKRIGLDQTEVLLRIGRLISERVISPIRGLLEPAVLGYQKILLGAQIKPPDLEEAALKIASHPGVATVCSRAHDFSLWFELFYSEEAKLEDQLVRLSLIARAYTIPLRLKKSYKANNSNELYKFKKIEKTDTKPDGFDKELLILLQRDFPLTDEPYLKWAHELGTTEEVVFDRILAFLKAGFVKRIASVLISKARPSIDPIWIAWQISEEHEGRVGKILAELPQVVQCVKRGHHPDFPFSLFAALQMDGQKDLQRILENLEEKIGRWPRVSLPLVNVYKDEPVLLFDKKLDDWLERYSFSIEKESQ